MSRKRPSKVFDVDGLIVLARSPKGAVTVARSHGKVVDPRFLAVELPWWRHTEAVNRKG